VRIRVPVEMLNEAAARLSKMEATLAQNDGLLNKAWSSLPMESRSRQTVESRIKQARGMAGRLSTQTKNMGNYLNHVGVSFVEADRRCSDGALKGASSDMHAAGKGVLHPGVIADRAKYESLDEEYNRLNISREQINDPPLVSGLRWYGQLPGLPGSGEAGAAVNIAEDIFYNNADAASVAGTGTVSVAGIGASKVAASTLSKVALAKLTAAGIAVSSPLIIKAGAAVAVGVGVSLLLNATIGNQTIREHASEATANIIRSAGDVASTVGSNAVQAGAKMVDSVSSTIQTIGDSVGNGVKALGQMANGFGEKLNLW